MIMSKKEAKKYTFAAYEPCPCGSKENYKFCCYKKSQNIDRETKNFPFGRILYEARKIF